MIPYTAPYTHLFQLCMAQVYLETGRKNETVVLACFFFGKIFGKISGKYKRFVNMHRYKTRLSVVLPTQKNFLIETLKKKHYESIIDSRRTK